MVIIKCDQILKILNTGTVLDHFKYIEFLITSLMTVNCKGQAMSRAQIKKQNRCKHVITNRNKEHNHRVNKQDGYIKMITDEKQNDRKQIKWKVLENDKILHDSVTSLIKS